MPGGGCLKNPSRPSSVALNMIQAPTTEDNRSRDKESHDNSPQDETSIPLEGDTSGQPTPLQEEKNVATATHSVGGFDKTKGVPK